MDGPTDGANVRFPPPLIYVAGFALGIVTDRVLRLPGLGASLPARSVAGVLLGLVGFLVMFAGAGIFLRKRTAIVPFKPATSLVTTGVLGWTRNPMYLGLAIFYVGLAVIFGSLAALLVLPLVLAIVETQVIAREEAYLERAFGSEYVAYKSRVRRWI
jgi:protein-S-isoprenylcysteine O-methyltransferase Ste14